jgi:uncharacterized protein (UPF0335 family)
MSATMTQLESFIARETKMTTRQQDCLDQMRDIYQQFDSTEIAYAIKVIRAEMTAEEQRHALQVEILEKQAALEKLNFNNKT